SFLRPFRYLLVTFICFVSHVKPRQELFICTARAPTDIPVTSSLVFVLKVWMLGLNIPFLFFLCAYDLKSYEGSLKNKCDYTKKITSKLNYKSRPDLSEQI